MQTTTLNGHFSAHHAGVLYFPHTFRTHWMLIGALQFDAATGIPALPFSVMSHSGARPVSEGIPRVCLLITDGASADPNLTVAAAQVTRPFLLIVAHCFSYY